MRVTSLAIGLLLLCALAGPSSAASITFSGTNTQGNLSASVTFDYDSTTNTLTVTLTNTSTSDVLVPSQVLTAVFFSGADGLTPVSAKLADGSTVKFGSDGGGNVGGEWAYKSGLTGAPHGATAGISSSGLGLFGGANFNGSNLQDPAALDGLQYGITSKGDNTSTGNAAVTGGNALIQYSVVFTFKVSSGFDLSKITNVSFQYGTSLSDPNVPVPEPGTMVLLGTGLVGIAGWGRKRYRK